jgi:Xaa-Pro dipeptidase
LPANDRLRRIFQNARIAPDVIAIVNSGHADPNFFYISGYRSGLFEGNILFLFSDGHVEVLTNPLEEQAARKNPDYKVHVERSHAAPERRRMISSILKGSRRVGVNFSGISHRDYRELEGMLGIRRVLDVSEALSAARMIKDPDELEALSKAAQIISAVIDDLPNIVEEGMTEKALKATIDYRMVEEGADSPSFESIVAFGENSALPHYSAGDKKLLAGENVLIDIGARYHLYCSDITRTFFCGRAPAAMRDAYSKVLEAQTTAIKGIRAGVTGRAVHQIASSVIDGSKFKGRFTHGLGHSLGLEVHDGIGLSPRNPQKLKENMVMTVEPGIYIPRRGGVRIEDDVVVTKGSSKVLTSASRELVEI